MREDSVNPAGNRTKTLDRTLLDRDATIKVLVAVQQGAGPVEGVECVVQSRALLRLPVSRAEEYPLLGSSHLLANFRVTLILESHSHTVQLETELAEVFVFPYGQVIVALRWFQNGIHVGVVLANHVLYVLLNYGYGWCMGKKDLKFENCIYNHRYVN